MPDDLPSTIPALEKKIAELEKKLAGADGLEARLIKQLEDKIAALEKKLADAKKEEAHAPTPAEQPRTRLSDHFLF